MPSDQALLTPPPLQMVPRRQPGVLTLTQSNFDQACKTLYDLACLSGMPDLLVAIPTGGLWVAQAMARSSRTAQPILPLTCRRPGTDAKRSSSLLRMAIARLPRPALDRLRLLEHRLINRTPPRPDQRSFDRAELAALREWFTARPPHQAVLVVDDAVDSGATLHAVCTQIRQIAPHAVLRSAAITVTTAAPLARPDHALYDRRLCRFPWSLDA